MPQTTSLLEAFFLCQQQARGDLGKALVADSVNNAAGSGYVQDRSEFAYTKMATRDLDGLHVWRYNIDIDDDDAIRRVIAVNTTTYRVTVDGGVYADIADLDYILIGFDPREALDAMRGAYNKITLRKDVVLTVGGYDLDMERPDEDYYDGTSGGSNKSATMSVVKIEATAENKVTGDFALELLAGAAGDYDRGPQIRVVPGDQIIAWPCLRVETGGPFKVRLFATVTPGATTGVYFGETQTYSGAEFAYLAFLNAIVPAGYNYAQVEVRATASGDKAWWDSTAWRAYEGTRFALEDWIDATYKLPLIRRTRFKNAIPGYTNAYAATKRVFVGDLVLNTDYKVENQQTEANTNVVDFEPQVDLGQDLFYLVTVRDSSDVEPWEDLTDTTTRPRNLLLAYLMTDLCDLLVHKTKDPYWQGKRNEWAARTGYEVMAREETPYQPTYTVEMVRI